MCRAEVEMTSPRTSGREDRIMVDENKARCRRRRRRRRATMRGETKERRERKNGVGEKEGAEGGRGSAFVDWRRWQRQSQKQTTENHASGISQGNCGKFYH